MKAVIMAGGEGTRLRPLTSNQPKPMMPLANRPMMEHIVRLLKEHGFDEIVVTLMFLPNAIRTYFGDGSEFGVRMVYATEESPLGTAGSVRNAMDELSDETFLVISGDVLTDIDLSSIVSFHKEKGATATIGLKAMDNPLDFGIVITRPDGEIERFLEKPTWGQVFSDTINTGIYVLEPSIFDYIPEGQQVDFSSDVFPQLLAEGKPLYGAVADGYWEDVGTLDAYMRAHQDVLDGKVELDLGGFRLGGDNGGIWLGEGSEIDPAAIIEGPVIIGPYSRVDAGATIKDYTVLGANVRVGSDAYLQRSVVHDNTYLGAGVRLRGAIVGRSGDLRRGVRAEEGVVLGDECFVGEHAVLNPNVKIYPFKTVEQGAVINTSIVWESRGARSLFGRVGVSGIANVDISPELVTKIALAYATTMKKGSRVTVSRDSSRAARALKRALGVGLICAGVNVEDLEVASVPVTRWNVRNGPSQGGVTVRLAGNDPETVVLRFFGPDGTDIDEGAQRKIERLFHREEARRVAADQIGDIAYPPRAIEFYTADLMDTVDAEAIRAQEFKLVLDYSFGSASFVMPNVLSKLGAEVLAVNPFAATAGATTSDLARQAQQVSALVQAAGAHLGAVIDPDGERLTLVDDTGAILDTTDGLFAMLSLVLADAGEHHGIEPDGSVRRGVALPVNVSRKAEAMCKEAGVPITWTKLSAPHLMEMAQEPGIAFAGGLDGGYLFPQFLPAFDATASLVHTLALLARSGVKLSKVVSALPTVHAAHDTVITPWEQKGLVMRTLVETTKDREQVLVDGVKVLFEDGWVLVLPDPEEPLTHVWAEAGTASEARSRALSYTGRIRQLLR